MDKLKRIDNLIMKYLIVGILLVIVVINHEIIFSGIQTLWGIISPIVFGAVMGYVLNILMKQFEKIIFPNTENNILQKLRRPISILLSFIAIILILLLVLNLVIPQLVSVIIEVVEVIPTAYESVRSWIIENEQFFPAIANVVESTDFNWQGVLQNVVSLISDFTSSLLETTFSTAWTLLGWIVNFFLSVIISIYILMSKEKLVSQFRRVSKAYLSRKAHNRFMYVIGVIDDSFSSFISGEVVEAMILGMLVTVGMWIFQFPYAGMIGALTGVTALIPILGAYLSGAIGFLLILVQSPIQALLFVVFIVVVQQFEGNVIYPRVVGAQIGLPGLWVLSAVTIGGGVAGIWGMLLAVPIASSIYNLVKNDVKHREELDERSTPDENETKLELTGRENL